MDQNNMQSITTLIPQSLDDIIRKRRGEAALRMASESDIEALKADIDHDLTNDVVDDWRLISIVVKAPGGIELVKVLLLGGSRNHDGAPWITSQVRKIDLARNVLITDNSIYGLGRRGEGEPNRHHLIAVCAAFHKWGFGETFGVPHFFY